MKKLTAILLSLLLSLMSVGLTLYVPILIGRAVDTMVGRGAVIFEALTPLLIRIGVCIGATALFQWLTGIINNRVTYMTVRNLRQEAFRHLHTLPLNYLDRHSSGDILSRMIADVDVFADGLLLGFTQLFTGAMTILGTLGFMLTLSPLITAVVVALVTVLYSGRQRSSKGRGDAPKTITDFIDDKNSQGR